ncbi:hypothetical protein IE985_28790 [Klebsiella pneumoniae]|nr:hypothetical protein [Klebsiella pneumoniae]
MPGANSLWAKPRRKRSIPKQPLTTNHQPPAAVWKPSLLSRWPGSPPWRIDRYARGSMLKTPFYQRAKNTDALPAARKAAEEVRDEKQAAVLRARQNQIANQPLTGWMSWFCSRA